MPWGSLEYCGGPWDTVEVIGFPGTSWGFWGILGSLGHFGVPGVL